MDYHSAKAKKNEEYKKTLYNNLAAKICYVLSKTNTKGTSANILLKVKDKNKSILYLPKLQHLLRKLKNHK